MTPAESRALGGITRELASRELLHLMLSWDRAGRQRLYTYKEMDLDGLGGELLELAAVARFELEGRLDVTQS